MCGQFDDRGELQRLLGTSFAKVAEKYARSRPRYPVDAVRRSVSTSDTVLELGAGTGLLSGIIGEIGPRVHVATDISTEMLSELSWAGFQGEIAAAKAEELPFRSDTFSVAIAAQAMHWFELDKAIPEIYRVLTPGGKLAMIWNHRDQSLDWVREFDRVTEAYLVDSVGSDIGAKIASSGLFTNPKLYNSSIRHVLSANGATDLIESFSHVSTMDEKTRQETTEAALKILTRNARDGLSVVIPYITEIYVAISRKPEA